MSVSAALEGRSVFRRSPEVVCRQVGAESILVPIRHNVGNLDYIYTLSEVAATVWTLLDGSRNVDAIVDTVCAEYDVERSQATDDVATLLGDLSEAALISQVNQP